MEDFLLVVVLIVLTVRWFVLSGRMHEMQRRIDGLESTVRQLRAEQWAPAASPSRRCMAAARLLPPSTSSLPVLRTLAAILAPPCLAAEPLMTAGSCRGGKSSA